MPLDVLLQLLGLMLSVGGSLISSYYAFRRDDEELLRAAQGWTLLDHLHYRLGVAGIAEVRRLCRRRAFTTAGLAVILLGVAAQSSALWFRTSFKMTQELTRLHALLAALAALAVCLLARQRARCSSVSGAKRFFRQVIEGRYYAFSGRLSADDETRRAVRRAIEELLSGSASKRDVEKFYLEMIETINRLYSTGAETTQGNEKSGQLV
jgi:hypothetical protein